MNNTPKFKMFAMIGMVCLLLSCSSVEKPARPDGAVSAAAAARPAIAVSVEEAKPSAEAGEDLLPAVISVENSAMVLAQRDGILTEVRVQEGSRVARGELLAQMSADDQRSQLRQAELEVSRSLLEEKQLEALVKVNKNELDQEMALAEDGLSSKRQIDRARFKLEANQEELERARLSTQTNRARVDSVKIEIEKATLRAPLTGIVIHRFVKLGAGVVKNDKLFEVSQLSPLQVRFQAQQAAGRSLNPGRSLGLSTADNDRIIAQARIRRLDPVADAASNTIGYWADVIGGSGLIPGMAVNVHLPRATSGNTFRISRNSFPATADLRNGAAATLFVVDADKCAARTVWITSVEGGNVVIGSGLSAGDRIILSPPADLKAGDAVTARKN